MPLSFSDLISYNYVYALVGTGGFSDSRCNGYTPETGACIGGNRGRIDLRSDSNSSSTVILACIVATAIFVVHRQRRHADRDIKPWIY
ncbi:hypothetical protein HDU96_001349 [Phlyctochytrium bullatum]|nr:hypothetical protein HDU96_001349 [Phlyctochytrium bullatum]